MRGPQHGFDFREIQVLQPCAIALGGNLGDVDASFDAALTELDKLPGQIVAVSSRYRTVSVGRAAGKDFLNAAAVIQTPLTAHELLAHLHAIEKSCGRARTAHWEPRRIDLDLILFGDEVIEEPKITVPHPLMWHRRFVLGPLAEIADQMVHPLYGQSVSSLLQRLDRRPLRLELGSSISESLESVIRSSLRTDSDSPEIQLTRASKSDSVTFADGGHPVSTRHQTVSGRPLKTSSGVVNLSGNPVPAGVFARLEAAVPSGPQPLQPNLEREFVFRIFPDDAPQMIADFQRSIVG